MEEQKQKIVNDLFAIRAGMSYIAELYGQIQNTKKSAYERKNKVKDQLCVKLIAKELNFAIRESSARVLDDSRVIYLETEIKYFVTAYRFAIRINSDLNVVYENAQYEGSIFEQIRNKCCALSGEDEYDDALYWDVASQYGYGKYDIEQMSQSVGLNNEISIDRYNDNDMDVNSLVAYIRLGKVENDENFKEYVRFLNEIIQKLEDYRKYYIGPFSFKAKKFYDKLIENFKKCKEAAPELKKQCKAVADECDKEVADNNGLAQNVYAAFVKEYSGFLDPRDWKNIDLLIYYLQTGRADSIKEALQLTDRQQQTDVIVKALHEINSTLRVGLNAINDTIIACTDRIVENQKLMLSQTALQNALLANASLSSARLDVTVHAVAG